MDERLPHSDGARKTGGYSRSRKNIHRQMEHHGVSRSMNHIDSYFSHTQTLNVFVQNEELKCCDMSDKSHIIYMYENVAPSTESILDNFIVSETLFRNIINYRSLHDGNNLSDHVLILLTLSLSTEYDEKYDSRQYVKHMFNGTRQLQITLHIINICLKNFVPSLSYHLMLYIAKIHRVRYIVMH